MNLFQSCKAALAICGCFMMIEGGLLFHRLQVDSAKITASVQTTLLASQTTMKDADYAVADLRRTLEITGGTLNLARQTLRNEQTSLQQANAQTIATMKGIDDLVQKSNGLVAHVDTSQAQVFADVHTTMQKTQLVIDTTNQTVLDIDKQVDNPDIAATLGHLNIAISNVQDTTLQFDSIAKFYEKRLTSPKGFATTLFHGILQLVTPGASVAGAIK